MGGSSGSKNSTTTQKTEPWSGLKPYLSPAYRALGDEFGTVQTGKKGEVIGWQPGAPPAYYPGSTVAGYDPLIHHGQNMQLGNLPAADWMSSLANQGVQHLAHTPAETGYGLGHARMGAENLLGYAGSNTARGGEAGAIRGMDALLAAGDPNSNPYFQGALASAMRPLTEQFTEQVLPQIRRNAMAGNGLGGSRQGIAEGLATKAYLNAMSDVATNMGNQAYGQGLGALQAGAGIGSGLLQQALGAASTGAQLGQNIYGTGLEGAAMGARLAPTAQQMGFVPGQMASQIGAQRTDEQQRLLDADMARWNYEQSAPQQHIVNYLRTLQGDPWSMSSATSSMPGRSTMDMLGGGLGGGLMGYAMGSTPAAIAAGANPWLYAAGGGLLGLF